MEYRLDLASWLVLIELLGWQVKTGGTVGLALD